MLRQQPNTRKRSCSTRQLLALCVLPLTLGAISYWCWRPITNLERIIYSLLPDAIATGLISTRASFHLPGIPFISDVFADVCWAIALTTLLQHYSNTRSLWLSLFCVTTIELVQLLPVIPGTFDIYDLIAMTIAVCFTDHYLHLRMEKR
ncbi:Uncharacterised protein [BD1-7 clade bacterium]|uniref:VanZ-like domain-containing protein n=1 Tax=BD1-7 clade bacterium TaxID=2029982 RepID=A0A5S9PLB4_9GAMM|nr:Uncharacterised protein [BD1-7 clade bacterium]